MSSALRKPTNQVQHWQQGAGEEKLQIVEQFEFVQTRIEDLYRHARGLVSLLKKRIQIQKDHLKAMQKLSQSVHDDHQLRQVKFEGELNSQWSTLCQGLLTEALYLSNISSTLESQALQPLTIHLLNDLDKRFKAAISEGRKSVRDLYTAKTAAQKAKEKYFSATGDWEACLVALYAETGDSWAPAPGNKLYEREQLTSKKSQELRTEYEQAMEKVNILQTELHSQQMPEVLLTLNTLALNMVSVVHNALKIFDSCQKQLLGPDNQRTQSPLAAEDLNVSEYTHRILFGGRTAESFSPPTPLNCQEYPFKDEALLLSTRKVQYRCMSQLSPEELKTRGTQFINKMDPKYQNKDTVSQTHPSPPPHTEINHYLISVCVEYLEQPLALKEEGLFRVSGDNSLMRALHKDFQSGTASKEYLRAAVMEQKDPNTISGLLKLHLRENGLLSFESMKILSPHLESRDEEAIVDTVLESLPTKELQPLLQVVSLLATIVQEPWMQNNKMTPRTLGIACGLSVFPDLDPGKATVFLETLIKKNEKLQGDQSIL